MGQYAVYRDKRVVVTGAASGIGRQAAEFLLADGAKVIALDRNPSDLKVEQFIAVDFTQPETITAAIKKLTAKLMCC